MTAQAVATAKPAPVVAAGMQTATIVGLDGEVLTTERNHQVKVQFAWQRNTTPSGADANNAPGNETSGTWVRVSEALAGPNWGTQFTPRIGVEVLVDFINADMDQPVIVAQLYNGVDTPPFAAGVDSGVNHGGRLRAIDSATGKPAVNLPYRIELQDGTVLTGRALQEDLPQVRPFPGAPQRIRGT